MKGIFSLEVQMATIESRVERENLDSSISNVPCVKFIINKFLAINNISLGKIDR